MNFFSVIAHLIKNADEGNVFFLPVHFYRTVRIHLITIPGDFFMGKNVLIVEDDEIIQQVLEWRLSNLGYAVCGKAATAEDAIRLAGKRNRMLSSWIST